MSEDRWISVTADGEASVAPDLAVVSFAATKQGFPKTAMKSSISAWASPSPASGSPSAKVYPIFCA